MSRRSSLGVGGGKHFALLAVPNNERHMTTISIAEKKCEKMSILLYIKVKQNTLKKVGNARNCKDSHMEV